MNLGKPEKRRMIARIDETRHGATADRPVPERAEQVEETAAASPVAESARQPSR